MRQEQDSPPTSQTALALVQGTPEGPSEFAHTCAHTQETFVGFCFLCVWGGVFVFCVILLSLFSFLV